MALRNPDPYADPTVGLVGKNNSYVEKISLSSGAGLPLFYGSSLKGLKGSWLKEFSSESVSPTEKLYLEVGCYKGETLARLAKEFPETKFVGMDITFKRVYMSASRLKKGNIENARCFLGNANFINHYFAEGELDGILLFFPDPWPKKSQKKHRLVNENFVKNAISVLKHQGIFWIKMDQPDYWQEARELLVKTGFEEKKELTPLVDFQTPFERIFNSQRLQLYSSVWQKP